MINGHVLYQNLKKILQTNKRHYKDEHLAKMLEILNKEKVIKGDLQNVMICEIKHDVKYKKDKAEYFLIKAIRAFVYGDDTNWQQELTKARNVHK